MDLPAENVAQILNGSFTDQAYEGMTTWLTGHPDAKFVLGCSINDQGATGLSGALEAAGWLGKSAIVGQGVDAPALAELHGRTEQESVFMGSVAYFPEKY